MYCRVTDKIFNIIRLLEEERKKQKDYGSGVSLGHAEVTLLETITRYPHENVSALSKRLGITKGAITQMVAKLCQKGLLEEIKREGNKKEKYFRLTNKGMTTTEGHQLFHKEANRKLCDFIAALDPREANAIFLFLECVKECVPFCEFPCDCERENESSEEINHDETTIVTCTRPPGQA